MSTLRITNIEAKADPSSPTVDEKIKLTNSNGDILVHIDGKTSGITTIGINTTAGNIKFDQNSNVVVTGIITATKFVGTIEPTTLTVTGDSTFSGNVGIGTNTISDNLEVFAPTNASLQIKGGAAGSDANRSAQLKLLASGSKLYVMEADATDGSFRILDSSTERVRITSAGLVGIGTDNPQGELHVKRTSSTGRIIVEGAALAQIGLRDNAGGTDSKVIQIRNNAQNLLFGTQNDSWGSFSEKFRITSDGDVGINQTSPSTALSVYDGQSSVNTVIRVGTNAVSSTNNGYAQVEFKHGSASSAWIWHNANSTTGFGGANSLNFYNGNAADYAFFSGGNNERFRIKSDGNVQITDGNLVLASGHGIDFSAAGNASGMSSELLDDYEEGTFTPNDASGAGLTFVEAAGIYTKVGRMVHVQVRVKYPSTSNNSYVSIGGLPFSATNQGTNISNGANASGFGYFTGSNLPQIHMSASGTHTNFYYLSTIQRNNNLSGLELRFGVVYSTS